VEPLRWIAQNAGSDGYVVVNDVRTASGVKASMPRPAEWVDLVKAGIGDPVKVTRNAVANRRLDRGFAAHDRDHHRGEEGAAGSVGGERARARHSHGPGF